MNETPSPLGGEGRGEGAEEEGRGQTDSPTTNATQLNPTSSTTTNPINPPNPKNPSSDNT